MNYIVIDLKKCIGCGQCCIECPSDVILFENEKPVINLPELCSSCGHCAAICPVSAIMSAPDNSRNPFVVQKIPGGISPDKLLFHKKRSIRAFKEQEIEKCKIEELIEYAEKAPSSHNLRARRYIVITKDKEINEVREKIIGYYKSLLNILNAFIMFFISIFNNKAYHELSEFIISFRHLVSENNKGNDKVFNNSKCIICIAAPNGSVHSKDDCIAAQNYMMLYGKTINIDSYIAGYAQAANDELEKYFKLEKGFKIFAVSVFGFGENEYKNEIIYDKPIVKWS